jgi:hypothetical protein
MPGKLRIKSWHTACFAASGLVIAGLVALSLYDRHVEGVRDAGFRQEVAPRFDDPACGDAARAPANDLPQPAELEDEGCRFVVVIRRRHFERHPDSPPLTAADVRTWGGPIPISWNSLAKDGALVGGAALMLFFVLGFAVDLVARWLPIVESPLRGLVARFPAGLARRLAPWLLQVGIFFVLGFTPLLILYALH